MPSKREFLNCNSLNSGVAGGFSAMPIAFASIPAPHASVSERTRNSRNHSARLISLWVRCVTLLAIGPSAVSADEALISQGTVWRYLDNGRNQGAAWPLVDFDDSGWSLGRADLGYGDGGETTEISFGSDSANNYITTYCVLGRIAPSLTDQL